MRVRLRQQEVKGAEINMQDTTEVEATKQPFYKTLYARVLAGILTGVLVGFFFPAFAQSMKPFGDGFIKLIRMMIAPIIFLSVVVGIANIGDTRKLGRVGLKALFYFEVVTTLALGIGLGVATIFPPGPAMNVDTHSLHPP